MRRPQSFAALAGLGFAVTLVASTVLSPGGPSSNKPATDIAAYYAHHARGDIAADYASILATTFLLVVFGAAASRMRSTAGTLLVVAAGAAAVFELSATAIEMALAASVHLHAAAATTGALYQVATRLFFLSTLAMGAAVGLVASDEDRSWSRWLGLVASGFLVVAGLSVAYPHGPLSVLLLPAWTLLLVWVASRSVAGLRRPQLKAAQSMP
jgi:hypothetical protein